MEMLMAGYESSVVYRAVLHGCSECTAAAWPVNARGFEHFLVPLRRLAAGVRI